MFLTHIEVSDNLGESPTGEDTSSPSQGGQHAQNAARLSLQGEGHTLIGSDSGTSAE
jgi:hypothetical protein